MKIKQLKKRQEELDDEMFRCPKCKGKEKWGLYREFGCEKDLDKWLEKEHKDEN